MQPTPAACAAARHPQFNPETWISHALVAGLHVQAEPGGLIVGFPDATAHPAVHAYQAELSSELHTAAGRRAVWSYLRGRAS